MGKSAGGQTKVQLSNSKYSLGKSSLGIIGAFGIMIFLITFMVYTPALKNSFVWDDVLYVYENNYMYSLNPQFLPWAFKTFKASNWHPLTWLSHAVDYAIWGLNPFGHHLTSNVLHGLNTLLVFLLVLQLLLIAERINLVPSSSHLSPFTSVQTVTSASVTSLLFGVHPLHVESVAWVAERKDLLCAFFFLLSLFCYLFFISSFHVKNRWKWFTGCLILFICALMSKPMAVTFPLVLLLLDIYPLKRFTLTGDKKGINLRPLFEKIPFLALSLIL